MMFVFPQNGIDLMHHWLVKLVSEVREDPIYVTDQRWQSCIYFDQESKRVMYPIGRVLTSDLSVNSFIMIVCKNKF